MVIVGCGRCFGGRGMDGGGEGVGCTRWVLSDCTVSGRLGVRWMVLGECAGCNMLTSLCSMSRLIGPLTVYLTEEVLVSWVGLGVLRDGQHRSLKSASRCDL